MTPSPRDTTGSPHASRRGGVRDVQRTERSRTDGAAALLGGEQIVTDTTLAARWQRVRRLAAQADSALGVGDLEAFGRLWRALMSELAPAQRPR